ncbi:TetR/AcrR family transcriptional regulator [Spirillospora sp. NPDC050679]
MAQSASRRLPRGRHALSREEVDRIQRTRLCAAMADVMAEQGYVATSVEDVLKRAGVSRQSFYRLFDSKADCFMASFDMAADILLRRVLDSLGDGAGGEQAEQAEASAKAPPDGRDDRDEPLRRFERAVTAYLDVLAAELPFARLFLVEVYAAGPEALRRRGELQATLSGTLADLLEVTDEAGRFTCQMIIAATSAMVTVPVAERDPERLHAIGPALIGHVRNLWRADAFGKGTGSGDRPRA